jgi:hypothetical protein
MTCQQPPLASPSASSRKLFAMTGREGRLTQYSVPGPCKWKTTRIGGPETAIPVTSHHSSLNGNALADRNVPPNLSRVASN